MMRRVAYGCAGAVLGSAAYDYYRQDERAFRAVLMPLAQRLLDGEDAHRAAVWAAKNKLIPRSSHTPGPGMQVKLWDLELPNPVGLAAGFDKDAECIEGMARVGFGLVEIGSVTPLPQPGNEKPRVFRLPEDRGVINRYGFNSKGHEEVEANVRAYLESAGRKETPCALGINLGKNKLSESAVEDYSKGITRFAPLADYLVVNVSSPNTPGLRNLQAKRELDELIVAVVKARDEACKDARKVPLLLKIAPDLSEQDKQDIATVVRQRGVDGLIVSNTTVSRPDSLKSESRAETGGLSGRPLREMATAVVFDMYRLTDGKVPIIGAGGIESGRDALDKIRAGASAVQVYSALTYHGPPLVKRIQRELEELMQEEGASSISELVGAAHRQKR